MAREIIAKTVLNRKKKRDPWFLDDYTFNPYSGCAFNCLYCYIRGSKYGIHMEYNLGVKINSIEVLEKQLALRAKKGDHGFIVLSSATDPYLKIEKDYQLTREALKVILKYRFPVHVITKSDLVLRDFDLLEEIDRSAVLPVDLKHLKRGTLITFSFSTLDAETGKLFEPGATTPSDRLEAVKAAKSNGFKTGISLMPLLPYITDTAEALRSMFQIFSAVPVDYIFPATITLFGEGKADSKTLVMNAIQKHYPKLYPEYLELFKSDYLPYAYRNEVDQRTKLLCKQYGIQNFIC
ncbi:MAG: radical SAM protein [Cyclobacteriaceae bacterium]